MKRTTSLNSELALPLSVTSIEINQTWIDKALAVQNKRANE
jgi:hypothetical protein